MTVVNGRVHVGSDNNNAPVSYAFDARTGSRLWKSRPITFGYRVVPAAKGDFPAPVRKLIGGRKAYQYTGGQEWARTGRLAG